MIHWKQEADEVRKLEITIFDHQALTTFANNSVIEPLLRCLTSLYTALWAI